MIRSFVADALVFFCLDISTGIEPSCKAVIAPWVPGKRNRNSAKWNFIEILEILYKKKIINDMHLPPCESNEIKIKWTRSRVCVSTALGWQSFDLYYWKVLKPRRDATDETILVVELPTSNICIYSNSEDRWQTTRFNAHDIDVRHVPRTLNFDARIVALTSRIIAAINARMVKGYFRAKCNTRMARVSN